MFGADFKGILVYGIVVGFLSTLAIFTVGFLIYKYWPF